MANDPRRLLFRACPAGRMEQVTNDSNKKSFLDSITGLGDLEVLNDVGGGDIGEGLRTLAKVSNGVRTNTALGTIVNTGINGVNDVLDTVGLGGAVDAVGKINPGVANRAYGQAEQIYDRVKAGNFELQDIPEAFQDFQNLEQLFRGIYPNESKLEPKELCEASPYAKDLIAFAPKFKFLFVVELELAPEYYAWTGITRFMSFVVKTSTRPKFDVEYEEVNMYNFRTRVPKRVEYSPMTMSFYDDNKDAVHRFYSSYMRAISPIANIDTPYPQTDMYKQSGMDYTAGPSSSTNGVGTYGHSASLGPLIGDTNSIIQKMTLYHLYDYGKNMNVYKFFNPRITTFSPSDLSQLETGDGTEFELEFKYDGLFIGEAHNLIDDAAAVQKLKEITGLNLYPLAPEYGSLTPDEAAAQATGESAQNAEDTASPSSPFKTTAAGVASTSAVVRDVYGNIVGGIDKGIETATSYATNTLNSGARNVVTGIAGGIPDTNKASVEVSKGITGNTNTLIGSNDKIV